MPNFDWRQLMPQLVRPRMVIDEENFGTQLGDELPEDKPYIPAPGMPAPPPAKPVEDAMPEPMPSSVQLPQVDPVELPDDGGPIPQYKRPATPVYDELARLALQKPEPPKPNAWEKIAALGNGLFGGWQAGAGRDDIGQVMKRTDDILRGGERRYWEDRARRVRELQSGAAAEDKAIDNARDEYQANMTAFDRAAKLREAAEKRKATVRIASEKVEGQNQRAAMTAATKGVIVLPPGKQPEESSELLDKQLYTPALQKDGSTLYRTTGRTKIDEFTQQELAKALDMRVPEYFTKETLNGMINAAKTRNVDQQTWAKIEQIGERLDILRKHYDNMDAVADKNANTRRYDADTKRMKAANDINNSDPDKIHADLAKTKNRIEAWYASETAKASKEILDANGIRRKPTQKEVEARRKELEPIKMDQWLTASNLARERLGLEPFGSVEEMKRSGWYRGSDPVAPSVATAPPAAKPVTGPKPVAKPAAGPPPPDPNKATTLVKMYNPQTKMEGLVPADRVEAALKAKWIKVQ